MICTQGFVEYSIVCKPHLALLCRMVSRINNVHDEGAPEEINLLSKNVLGVYDVKADTLIAVNCESIGSMLKKAYKTLVFR